MDAVKKEMRGIKVRCYELQATVDRFGELREYLTAEQQVRLSNMEREISTLKRRYRELSTTLETTLDGSPEENKF